MVGALILFGLTIFLWFVFSVIRPISYIKWLSWKKKARLAISNQQTTHCRICHDHIFPGERVVRNQIEVTPGGFLVHIDIPHTIFSLGGSFFYEN